MIKKGKNVPKNVEYQFRVREDSKKKDDEGKKVKLRPGVTKEDIEAIKELNYSAKIADSIKFLRTKVYDLTLDELSQLTGITSRTITNYESGKDRYDVNALLKIAQAFSSIPTKEGRYQRITFDNICGLTPFSSLDNEDIHDQLGLEDNVIEHLRAIKDSDKDRIKHNTLNLDAPIVELKVVRMVPINFLLASDELENLCDEFMQLAQPIECEKVVYQNNDEFIDIPGNKIFAANRSGMIVPLSLDDEERKATTQIKIMRIISRLVDDYQEKAHRDFIEMFREWIDAFREEGSEKQKAYSDEKIVAIIFEYLKNDPGHKTKVRKMIAAVKEMIKE